MQDRIAMVVLGMHRSGTSAMAGALAASGFQPPKTQMPPQPENPAGYWESPVISDLNDEILAAQDASWDDVFPVDEASLLSNFGVFFLGKAADVLKAEFGDAPRIVLKDPRICLLANVWKRTLADQGFRTHFVLVIRHPGEVAASLARRNEFSRDKSLLLWLSSMISAERKTRGESRSFVLYDDLLADPQGVLDRIEADFGQALPRRTRMAEIEVERVVDQGLRTHAHGERPHRKGELNRLAHQGYEGFRAAARGEAPDIGLFDALSRRLAEIEEVAGGVLSELRLHAHELNGRIDEARGERQALAQRVAVLEPLAAEAGRVGTLQLELETERTSVKTLHAQASELTHAAGEAARALEQQRDGALAEAQAVAQNLVAARQAVDLQRGELEDVRADLARDAEHRQQLQQAHDALAHGLAAEQAATEAAQARGRDLDRLVARMREADSHQLTVHQAQVDDLSREIAAEQAAARAAQAQARTLEDALAQLHEATTRQQSTDRAEIEELSGRLRAEQAASQTASDRCVVLERDAKRITDTLAAARGEIEGLGERLKAEQAAAQSALDRSEAFERDAARSAESLAAAAAKSDALADELAQAQLSRVGLTDQVSDLRTALDKAKMDASDAVAAMGRRLAEREARLAVSDNAVQARFEAERGAKARLEDTIARLTQVGAGQAEAMDQFAADLEAERSAVRLMVGDLIRVTSDLDTARREAADLRGGLQRDRAELSSVRSESARLNMLLSAERAQAAQRLDRELNHSGALSAELASVKQMLAYLTTRWWWRAIARARGVAASG